MKIRARCQHLESPCWLGLLVQKQEKEDNWCYHNCKVGIIFCFVRLEGCLAFDCLVSKMIEGMTTLLDKVFNSAPNREAIMLDGGRPRKEEGRKGGGGGWTISFVCES